MKKVLAVLIGTLALTAVACKTEKTPTAAPSREATRIASAAKAPGPTTFFYEAPTVVVTALRPPRAEQVVIMWEAPMITVNSPRPVATKVAKVSRSPKTAKPKL